MVVQPSKKHLKYLVHVVKNVLKKPRFKNSRRLVPAGGGTTTGSTGTSTRQSRPTYDTVHSVVEA
jgi:hypothetical protein